MNTLKIIMIYLSTEYQHYITLKTCAYNTRNPKTN
jgi:hypothetical protein